MGNPPIPRAACRYCTLVHEPFCLFNLSSILWEILPYQEPSVVTGPFHLFNQPSILANDSECTESRALSSFCLCYNPHAAVKRTSATGGRRQVGGGDRQGGGGCCRRPLNRSSPLVAFTERGTKKVFVFRRNAKAFFFIEWTASKGN